MNVHCPKKNRCMPCSLVCQLPIDRISAKILRLSPGHVGGDLRSLRVARLCRGGTLTIFTCQHIDKQNRRVAMNDEHTKTTSKYFSFSFSLNLPSLNVRVAAIWHHFGPISHRTPKSGAHVPCTKRRFVRPNQTVVCAIRKSLFSLIMHLHTWTFIIRVMIISFSLSLSRSLVVAIST